MKLQPIRLANALAISQAILTVLCGALAYAMPDLVIRITRGYAHPLDISPLIPASPRAFDFGEFGITLFSWMILVWLSGWLAAVLYNALVPKVGES